LPGWDWLKAQIASAQLSDSARRALLAGRAPGETGDEGPTVCACFGVGRSRICKALESGTVTSADDVGRMLKAGTNCGSCLPEIRRLVGAAKKDVAHEPAH
jgi:assimilatory nitrate reductase catalytic subunit